MVKTSLHLNTFNQFQIRFKTCFTTTNRNAETICRLFLRRRHTCNRRVQNCFCGTEFIVDHKTQTNVRFERITIVLTMFLMFLPQRPCGTF